LVFVFLGLFAAMIGVEALLVGGIGWSSRSRQLPESMIAAAAFPPTSLQYPDAWAPAMHILESASATGAVTGL